jgi:predicted alpha/beta superfamily hydrolase
MVEFVLRSPGLQPWDAVYITGDADPLGRWRPDARRLDWHDGTFRTHLDLPAGSRCRYLFTRGSWRAAELAPNGQEHPPRELTAVVGLRVEVEVCGWGRNSVRYHPDFPSQFLPHAHTLTVHMPPEYDLHPYHRYPVLYLHDGQNLFDAHTSFAGVPWGADETAERLARCGEAAAVIQVGVANSPDRLKEYGPKPDDPTDLTGAYSKFLIDEVKPFIDREYRTRPEPAWTGVCGSSMGGLISLHLCRRHPHVFGRCAALSPSLWWDDERLVNEVGDDPGGLARCKLWLDMGTREGHSSASMGAMTRRAARLAFHLRKMPPDRFRYTEVEDGLHNEEAWGRRYPDVLRFLYPSEA